MFDLSFSECLVIALGALAVTKPEDIPGTARQIGKTLGKIRAWRDEWQGHIREVTDDLTRLPEKPEAPSARPPAAAMPEGEIVMYRPDGSDTAYERYVEHPPTDSALPAYGPTRQANHEDAEDRHAMPDIDTQPQDAFDAMREAERLLQARLSGGTKGEGARTEGTMVTYRSDGSDAAPTPESARPAPTENVAAEDAFAGMYQAEHTRQTDLRHAAKQGDAPRPRALPQIAAQDTPPMWRGVYITLFPELYPGPLGLSVTGKALGKAWTCETIDLRDHCPGKHRRADDTPYGGGPGMVMRADAAGPAVEAANATGLPLYCLSPRGKPFRQEDALRMSKEPGAVFLCPRFEGPDQRVLDHYPFTEISLGDFIMTNGDLAALCISDAIIRLLPGALGNEETLSQESFGGENFSGLLEYPLYTKPSVWKGLAVPETLLSGHHANIAAWRRQKAEELTRERRPDLWDQYLRSEAAALTPGKKPGKHRP